MIGSYYVLSRFPTNETGKFDERVLDDVHYGIDRLLNPCTIKNGRVTRKYDSSGEVPSYVERRPVGPTTAGVYFNRTDPESRKQIEQNVYERKADGSVKKVGIINRNGKYEGNPIRLTDTLYDGRSYELTFTPDRYVLGHEGPIFTGDGYRLYIDKYNQVDVVQTKIYLLFDYIATLASKMGMDFEQEQVLPYLPEDDEKNDYGYRFITLYLQSAYGLDVCYNHNYYVETRSISVSIDGNIIAQLEFSYNHPGYIHGVMLIDGKYVDVSKIDNVDALNKTIDGILSRAKDFDVDHKKTFESDDNYFEGVNHNRYTSLETLQQENASRKRTI